MTMNNPYPIIRPLLFALEPERAHQLTFLVLDRLAQTRFGDWLTGPRHLEPFELMGLHFANRVGLAAGLDKNGDHIDALGALGFGFLEIGTVTPRPQPGNSRPRIFRIPRRQALINRLGFNNNGLDAMIANLERSHYRGVLGINIGKNGATPQDEALSDYRECLVRVYPYASYVTINVSSPNTKDLRQLQGGDELDHLLGGLAEAREALSARHGKRVPLVLKIAPDLDEAQIERISEALVTHGMDGVIATNTTISRDAVAGEVNAGQTGGLSGAPVFEMSNKVIRSLREHLPAGFPMIGVGGVLSGRDASAKIAAGADLIQIYTGLIYRGPALIAECARALGTTASDISPSEI
jgi:dihydroorotate dehydrogenase